MTFSRLNLFFLCKDTKKNKKPSYFHKFLLPLHKLLVNAHYLRQFVRNKIFKPIYCYGKNHERGGS